MKLSLNPDVQQLLKLVRSCVPENLPVYLVGGAVRDLLLGQTVNDLDFVLPSGSLELAKKVRRQLGAVGYTLDDERQTGRVILNQGEPNEIILDFVSYARGSLQEDLKSRDFTINTMAVDLDKPEELLDFLGGEQDLYEHRLQAASSSSMQLDPLRVLRGIRFVRSFHLQIEPETMRLMQEAAPRLKEVSGERIRDELFKILSQGNAASAFRMMDEVGALLPIFPDLAELIQQPAIFPHVHPLWEHTLQVISYIEVFLEESSAPSANAVTMPYIQTAQNMLSSYIKPLKEMLNKPLQAGRKRQSLLILAALYHDAGKPLVQTQDAQGRFHFYGHEEAGMQLMENRARALMLGKEEIAYLVALVKQHMQLHFYSKPETELTDRAIYRYFQNLGEAGLDNAILSLADTLAAFEDTLPMEAWQREVNAVEKLFSAWNEQQKTIIQPPKLLDGKDLQHIFQLKPGHLIGESLEALQEAQAAGEIHDQTAAIDFIQRYLELKKREGEAHEN